MSANDCMSMLFEPTTATSSSIVEVLGGSTYGAG